jgi:hypothetical protein
MNRYSFLDKFCDSFGFSFAQDTLGHVVLTPLNEKIQKIREVALSSESTGSLPAELDNGSLELNINKPSLSS